MVKMMTLFGTATVRVRSKPTSFHVDFLVVPSWYEKQRP